MYYLIQKNIFADPRYDEIFRALVEFDLPHETVEMRPNSNQFDFQTARKDVFVYGSVKLAKAALDFDWRPGSFYGGNHEFLNHADGYGDFLLNSDGQVYSLSDDLDWEDSEQLFIRPSKDSKVFKSKLYSKIEWQDFKHHIWLGQNNLYVSADTQIQVSKPKTLLKEARTWVVGGKVVTSSYYRIHYAMEYEEQVAQEGLDFAQQMASRVNIADAYVLDVALTPDGWRVIEVNCINCAGFYKADVKAIVLALEDFYSA